MGAADKEESLHWAFRRRRRPQAVSFMRWLGRNMILSDTIASLRTAYQEKRKGQEREHYRTYQEHNEYRWPWRPSQPKRAAAD